jgi:hypothetical protein
MEQTRALTMETDKKPVEEYIGGLTEIQKKAMSIAKEHLGSSFNLVKSVGYMEHQAKQEKK